MVVSIIQIALTLAAIFFIWVIWDQRHLDVTTYTIESEKCPKEEKTTKFVVLADLHNRSFGTGNAKLLQLIDKVAPDFIIVAGDMLIGKPNKDFSVAVQLLEKLSSNYKIYYGMGNHENKLKEFPEIYGDMYNRYIKKLESLGIQILDNKKMDIQVGRMKYSIYGLNIDFKYYKRFMHVDMKDNDLKEKLGACNQEQYNILIAHNPQFFKQYELWGADLILSGHLHGGIVRIPFLGGMIAPNYKIFPKYDAGKFNKNKTTMLVSRGLGMHTIPIRVFNHCELVVVELVSR